MSNMILRPDGTPDWRAMTEAANLNPPAASPQQLIAELRLLNIQERSRIDALVREGGLAALQKEHDAADSSFRRTQEAEGHLRTAAETKRLADALEARALEQASNPTPILDAQTEARRKYDDAIAAIQ